MFVRLCAEAATAGSSESYFGGPAKIFEALETAPKRRRLPFEGGHCEESPELLCDALGHIARCL